MKNDEHDDRLLDDLLTGSGADDFRAEMLNRTLGQVRRRKLARQWGRGTLAAVLVAAGSLLFWRTQVPRTQIAVAPPPASLSTDSSHPFDAVKFVRTEAGSVGIISSADFSPVVTEIRSSPTPFNEINDDELLELTKGTPAVLVRSGPHQAELLIAGADDRMVSPGIEPDR